MIDFTLNFSTTDYILLAVNCLIVIYITTFHRCFISKVKNFKAKNSDENIAALPAISVIVYCRDNAERLAKLLPQILNQKYDAKFEVIVVNDGSSEDTKDVFNYLAINHKNLYQTFIPKGADNISPKKLALTLGVKASQYEYMVFTNADAVIDSELWLDSYGKEFAKGKDVVIGNSIPTRECSKKLSSFIMFDILADRVTIFSSALFGRIYRCSTYNTGYKKDLFLENKSFSRHINLNYGDDDIFIRLFANASNTSLILDRKSLVECNYTNPRKFHSIMKQRNIYTRKNTTPFGRNIMAVGSFATWLWLATTIAGVILSLPNIIPSIIYFVLCILFWTFTILAWKKAAKALSMRVSAWGMPLFILYRPVYNLIYKLKTHRNRRLFYVLR